MRLVRLAAISNRPVINFESGYTVETVFDGSKLGIEPYAVEVSPSGELLVLDSANSNLYRISPPLSRYSRPKLVAGSTEGYSGHVDGKPREARMNHPRSLTVDDRGNIYIADAMNMAIRKISDTGKPKPVWNDTKSTDTGVTTIAGGKWSKGGHVDGPSEDAKFSNDFELVYIGSSCSLLIVDRGNRAIRIAVLVAAGFFGYMLALLQHRVGAIVASQNGQEESVIVHAHEPISTTEQSIPPSPYQKAPKPSARPPLIPVEHEIEKQDGFFMSLGRLLTIAGSSVKAVIGGFSSSFRRKQLNNEEQHQYQQQRRPNTWPMQESYVIPSEDEPPSLETRTPTPRKTYAFMSKDTEKTTQFRLGRSFQNGWDGDTHQPQPNHQQHHRRHYSTTPHTYYKQSCETTNEIVFGAVEEKDGKRGAMEIKPVDYGDPMYDHYNIRSWGNYLATSK
ncbi:hypothetical protein ACLOJK_035342 [Asimina triloba]